MSQAREHLCPDQHIDRSISRANTSETWRPAPLSTACLDMHVEEVGLEPKPYLFLVTHVPAPTLEPHLHHRVVGHLLQPLHLASLFFALPL